MHKPKSHRRNLKARRIRPPPPGVDVARVAASCRYVGNHRVEGWLRAGIRTGRTVPGTGDSRGMFGTSKRRRYSRLVRVLRVRVSTTAMNCSPASMGEGCDVHSSGVRLGRSGIFDRQARAVDDGSVDDHGRPVTSVLDHRTRSCRNHVVTAFGGHRPTSAVARLCRGVPRTSCVAQEAASAYAHTPR